MKNYLCGLRQRSCPQYLDWVSRKSAGVTLWRAETKQKRGRLIEPTADVFTSRSRFTFEPARWFFTTTESVIWCNVPNPVVPIQRDELFLFCVQKLKGVLTKCTQRFTFTPQVQHVAIHSSCDVLTCHLPGHTCAQALYIHLSMFCLNVALWFPIEYYRLCAKRLCFVCFLVYKIYMHTPVHSFDRVWDIPDIDQSWP